MRVAGCQGNAECRKQWPKRCTSFATVRLFNSGQRAFTERALFVVRKSSFTVKDLFLTTNRGAKRCTLVEKVHAGDEGFHHKRPLDLEDRPIFSCPQPRTQRTARNLSAVSRVLL